MIVYLSCMFKFWSFAWSYWKRYVKLVFTKVTSCLIDLSPNLSPPRWHNCVLPFFAGLWHVSTIASLRTSVWGNGSAPALSFIPFTWLFYLICLWLSFNLVLPLFTFTWYHRVLSSGTKTGKRWGGWWGAEHREQRRRNHFSTLCLYVSWLLISFHHWIISRRVDGLQHGQPVEGVLGLQSVAMMNKLP